MPIDMNRFRVVQLKLLDAMSDMCAKADVPWILWAGTLLGAVRHESFIPWDDDLDVALMRSDFETLLSRMELPEGVDFVDKVHPTINCARISMKGTTEVDLHDWGYENGHIPPSHQGSAGVYCDIFPLDYVPDDVSEGQKFVDRLNPAAPRWHEARKRPEMRAAHKALSMSCGVTGHVSATIWHNDNIPISALFPAKDVIINGKKYPGPQDADVVLTSLYGDWRTPTPEGQRGHHHMFVDLDHDWREYISNRTLPPCVKKG